MIRGGLRLILEDQPDITVVGEAVDGVDAIEQARRLRPDVCLVDIRMPRVGGIVVTTFDLDEYVYGALRGGAVGFILKDAGPALLVEAVRAAHNGDALVSPSVTVRLLKHLTAARGPLAAPTALSERELEVVRE